MKRQTLEAIRNFQNERKANPGLFALPDAKLEGEVPGFPGLITAKVARSENMKVTIARPDDFSTNPLEPDTYTLWVQPNDQAEWKDPIIIPAANVPATGLEINVVRGRRPIGINKVKYSIEVFSVGNTTESIPQLLIIDLDPPFVNWVGTPPAPVPPIDLPSSVEADYFLGKPNQSAIFTLPSEYLSEGAMPGDKGASYYGDDDEPYFPVPGNPDPFWVIPADLSFPLPLSVVQAHPDGEKALRVVYVDAAGNESKKSGAFRFDVSLFPKPSNFKTPTIDLASPGDGLTNRADVAALNGMIVRIPEYDNVLRADDELIITLTTSLGPQTLPGFPVGSAIFPIPVHVNYATLVALYGATVGLLPLTVSYAVKRRSVRYAAGLTATTNLDLDVVGPTPEGPDPINTKLNRVRVIGVRLDGTEGPDDDQLTPAHASRDAIARIRLWDEPPTPDARDFTIKLFYNGNMVDSRLITGGVANEDVDMVIPWAAIFDGKNGTKLAYYTIESTGTTNSQQSPLTPVNVTAIVISLDAPRVRNLNAAGFINCDSFRPVGPPPGDLVVFIPPSNEFRINMVVTLHSQGYSDDLGTTPVSAAVGLANRTILTETDINLGFEMNLGPYATIFKTIQPNAAARLMGSMKLWYSIPFSGGPLNSDETLHRARGHRAGAPGTPGTFCDGTAVPV
ncbi:hypothetical protein C4J93_2303 [Pseudomonas sp. R2-37-08W]|uniref:hypothetical protein n=1 Tax=Pseudomonas sp. R2-37-08W TaxID=1173273 RepID=UPI000F6F5156|nr:hypothetical protein [Pseudomonas sp. R2-37-08W]AZF10501.1 hypothetical protein C4J93_2303 [Pseudomonas sp. R2-37-08W]